MNGLDYTSTGLVDTALDVCVCLPFSHKERVHGPSPDSLEVNNLRKVQTQCPQPLCGDGSQGLRELLRKPPRQVVAELVLEPRCPLSEARDSPLLCFCYCFNFQPISWHQLILMCQMSRDCPFCQLAHGFGEECKSSSQRLAFPVAFIAGAAGRPYWLRFYSDLKLIHSEFSYWVKLSFRRSWIPYLFYGSKEGQTNTCHWCIRPTGWTCALREWPEKQPRR